jgi:hypothetical protein
LALTPPTSGGRSVGLVRSRTQATEFVLLLIVLQPFVGPWRLFQVFNLIYNQKDPLDEG